MKAMRDCGLLIALLAAATPPVSAADHAAMHGGHDHAAMMSMMAKPAAWTSYPMLKTRTSGENRDVAVTTAVPQNIVATNIDAWSNDLKDERGHRQLALDMSGAKLDKSASGGFHWLSAREEQADRVLVASTVYYYGERGAKDPTAMFLRPKHELEIIPQPFPREHSRYRADESWKFLLRFNGKPLPDQKVVLQTQNGTRSEWMSDALGVIAVRIPDDFKAEEEQKETGKHSHGMPGADFVLAAEYAADGKTYLTTFNSNYGKNAYDKRSLAMGLGFTLLGMIGAVPLLRQRKTGQKNEEADNA